MNDCFNQWSLLLSITMLARSWKQAGVSKWGSLRTSSESAFDLVDTELLQRKILSAADMMT